MTTILVVDDEAVVRELISEALQLHGHTVIQTGSPEKVNELLGTEPVELVITDLIMPGKNGLELIMELRSVYPHVKIIAISAGTKINTWFDYLPVARMIGADTILRKPFKVMDLCNSVDRLMDTRA